MINIVLILSKDEIKEKLESGIPHVIRLNVPARSKSYI